MVPFLLGATFSASREPSLPSPLAQWFYFDQAQPCCFPPSFCPKLRPMQGRSIKGRGSIPHPAGMNIVSLTWLVSSAGELSLWPKVLRALSAAEQSLSLAWQDREAAMVEPVGSLPSPNASPHPGFKMSVLKRGLVGCYDCSPGVFGEGCLKESSVLVGFHSASRSHQAGPSPRWRASALRLPSVESGGSQQGQRRPCCQGVRVVGLFLPWIKDILVPRTCSCWKDQHSHSKWGG